MFNDSQVPTNSEHSSFASGARIRINVNSDSGMGSSMSQGGSHAVRYSSTSIPKASSCTIALGAQASLSSEKRGMRVFGSWKMTSVRRDN